MHDTDNQESQHLAGRIQLHLNLPFNHQPRDHPTIRGYLERGYRIEELQRVTDHEVLVTLNRA